MNRRTVAAALILIGVLAPAAAVLARDPGDTPTRAGGSSGNNRGSSARSNDGFVPERIDPNVLHPPTHVEPPEPPLYQRVESDVDRGNGRIEDEHTFQLRRRQEDRDFPPGRFPQADIQRNRDRFQEDLDRRDRLDRRAANDKANQAKRVAAAAKEVARPPEPLSQPIGSTLTRWVAQQSKLLDAARQKYQSDLAAAEAERADAMRTAPTREGRAKAAQQFDVHRAELTRAYQEYRKKILGTDEPPWR
jgi:hypothetical protein